MQAGLAIGIDQAATNRDLGLVFAGHEAGIAMPVGRLRDRDRIRRGSRRLHISHRLRPRRGGLALAGQHDRGQADRADQERRQQVIVMMVAFGDEGYRINPKTDSGGEIGRMFIKEVPHQFSLDVGLVIKPDEFDAIWELTTKRNVTSMIGTFVCFNPEHAGPGADSEMRVAAILASSFQMMPDA